MEEENFFHFVHSLSKNEKEIFYRLFVHGKKENNETKLFKLILSCKNWNEKTRGVIHQAGFSHSALYYNTRSKLAQRIFRSLISNDTGEYAYYVLIERSIQKAMLDISNSFIREAVRTLQKEGNLLGLVNLLRAIKNWGRSYDIHLKIPDKTPSLIDLEAELLQREQLEAIRLRIKHQIQNGEAVLDGKTVLKVLQGYAENDEAIRYLKQSIRFLLHYNQREFAECLAIKERIVNDFAPGSGISRIQYLKEIDFLIILACELGDREVASRYSLFLTNQKVTCALEEERKTFLVASGLATMSKQFGLPQFASIALKAMETNRKLFPQADYFRFKYLIALCTFLNEDWTQCLQVLKSVAAGSRYFDPYHKAEMALIKVLALLELERDEDCEEVLKSLKGFIKRNPMPYFKAVCKCLDQVMSAGIFEKSPIYKESRPHFEEMELSPELGSLEFKFSLWLAYKTEANTPAEILRAKEYSRNLKLLCSS